MCRWYSKGEGKACNSRGGGAESARRRRTRSTVAREERWEIDRKKNGSSRRTVVTVAYLI